MYRCCAQFLRASKSVRLRSTAASNRSLDGKVAVVTASTEGIGLAIAKQLARDGAKVMISSREQENVTKAVSEVEKEEQGCSVKGVVCHVANPEHRKNLIEQCGHAIVLGKLIFLDTCNLLGSISSASSQGHQRLTLHHFGGIDILVSNAAVNPVFGPLIQTPEDAWDKIFNVNLKSAFMLAKDTIPLMEKRRGGSVIFISTIAAFKPFRGLGAYGVSKTALVGLTKVLADECGHLGVRVNCVAPGIIKTKFSEALWSNDSLSDHLLKMTPLGRLGVSSDISGAVSFLSSDQASYITGETLVVSGGMHSRL
ncbi:dehydrogenase/reductase SDR family member 4-like isoform X1 [Montipora capricornis]|uniref:dehydrogenase/reductase SDR family member 4-like isoform X1 n=1 Tax=Montipora capricornis TaxID=246305 RepID=UPI0035F13C09